MPMRLGEGTGGAAIGRDELKTFPAGFAGKKAHVRPGRGLPPLDNPEGYISRTVSTGNGTFSVFYEGGRLKVELSKKSGEGISYPISVADFDLGAQKASDIEQGIVKATEKKIEKGTVQKILDAMKGS